MNEGQIYLYLLLELAAAYAPFIVADGLLWGGRGGGVWKFLSFCFCTLAILSGFLGSFGFGLGVVLWLIAWVFAGVTRHTVSRNAVQNATLRAIQEQNELLRKQQPELLTNQQSVDDAKPFLEWAFSGFPTTHIMVKSHSKDGTSTWHEPPFTK